MPKPTFHNLPPEKRQRFVEQARAEFVARPYDQASISAIVKRLGIAKGSVYQYFDNKLDLFTWLVSEAQRVKMAWFHGLATDDRDPFDQLRFAYREGLRYWRDEPEWSRLALRVLDPSVDPGFRALRAAQVKQGLGFLEAWLAAGQTAGFVRQGLDLPTTARLIHGMLSQGLLSAFLARLDTDIDGFLANPNQFTDEQVAKGLRVADEAVELMRRALEPGDHHPTSDSNR